MAGNNNIVENLLNEVALPDVLRDQVRPGLAAALASLAREQGLKDDGRGRAIAQFQNNLSRLAAIAADRLRYPEIAEVKIERPVFILGLPRCGTSLLHALIGTDDNVRTPMSWEVAAPSPPPEAATFRSDPRAAAFDKYVDENFVGPLAEVRKAHPIGAWIPQECGMILETSFQSLNLPMLFRLRDYYQWYLNANTVFAYQVHKMWLQHLAWRNPRARWVLKVQEHAYHIPELLSVYPDAMFVQPHRDPVTVLASISRLLESLRSMVFARQDRAELGEELLHLWHDGQVKMMAQRAAHPDMPMYDLRYKDISRDPVGAVQGIYDFAGIAFSSETAAGITQWLAANPADKHGRHTYTLEDYGLTGARVRDVYNDYIQAYKDYI
ncbi:sulfotransferase [Acidocella aquatica]|uniref:Sulfotransferase n=2 Tax=Acidocella aquatica TaxID=1922313 RepID=A0ABQ6ACS3_9PROT|nr:sulfotransferase [Acidocella aquatica]